MNHLDDITLNEYLDHALDESRHAEVALHLHICIECRAKLEGLQLLFTELGSLPDTYLETDLTPSILARLPRNKPIRIFPWTRTLAAQLGIVFGFIFWLGMQVTPFIMFPQITSPKLPTISMQTLFVQLFSVQFPIPKFQFPDINYQMPTINIQLPFPSIQLSTNHIIILAISTLLLWGVGNLLLLKGRPEVGS
jgi:hypothetical protein